MGFFGCLILNQKGIRILDEKPAESKNSMLKSYEFQEIVKICFNEGDYVKLVSKVVDLYKKGNIVVVSSYKKK